MMIFILVCMLILDVILLIGIYDSLDVKASKCVKVTMLVAGILFTILSLLITYNGVVYRDQKYLEQYVAEYSIGKETLTKSIQSSKSSIDISIMTNSINEMNMELAKNKHEYHRWNYWYLDTTELDKLEYIDIWEGK